MKPILNIVDIDGRKIVIGGIGKMFYQDGFPIPLSIEKSIESGHEVSVLHIADELLKNGFPKKRVLASLTQDMILGDKIPDIDLIERFCDSDYEAQRQMIFQYLFTTQESAISFFKKAL